MSWRADSSFDRTVAGTRPLEREEILCRDEELAWLMRHERSHWKLINGRIMGKGDPTMMAEGLYGGVMAIPNAANAPSVACVATTTPGVCLWWPNLYSPIPNNGIMFPSAYKLISTGSIQTSTTTMTSTFLTGLSGIAALPGSAGSAPAVTTKTFGASGVVTLATTALTALYHTEQELILQAGGTSGTAISTGKAHFTTAAAPATSAQVSQFMVGGTQATAVDFTGSTANLPGGFFMSSWNTGTAGTTTFVPQIIVFESWN